MQLSPDFCHQMELLLNDEYSAFLSAIDDEEPVSIRLNPAKYHPVSSFPQVPWCKEGYYLGQRPAFTFDPLFHAGAYYVQEASSMFLRQVVLQLISEPVKALDLCAAPGGKSTLLLSSLPQGSLLVANEVIKSRVCALDDNLKRWGAANVIVSNNDPADFGKIHGFFDLVLTDVPCSGEGMFRKEPQAIEEWSPENVARCVARQQRIVKGVWPSLKPGGLLIYSTCTYNTRENEENIDWICSELSAEPIFLHINPAWNISGAFAGTSPCYRFFPHRTWGEGFFLSVLRKSGRDNINPPKEEKKRRKESQKNASPFPHSDWLQCSENFIFRVSETKATTFSSALYESMQMLQQSLKIVSVGLQVAELKGKEWTPTHALALSVDFERNAFPAVELNIEEAIRYLRKEAIRLPQHLPCGYVLVMYKNIPIGWVKNIGSRSNNLYPQEYRIKTTYTPNGITSVLP